jgi:hypothetical protein
MSISGRRDEKPLHRFLSRILITGRAGGRVAPPQWIQKTPFCGWTPWDEIAHLRFFDETALLAATDPEAFAADTTELGKKLVRGLEIGAIARTRFGHLSGSELVP